MPTSARLRGVALVLASAFVLSACAATPEVEVTQEQAPTGEVVEEVAIEPVADDYVILYSGRNETLVQPLIDAFTEQTGITVDIRYAGSSELAAQLLEEVRTVPRRCSSPKTQAHWAHSASRASLRSFPRTSLTE
jgi:ABC-type Fe3+ transport system, periplasmic component